MASWLSQIHELKSDVVLNILILVFFFLARLNSLVKIVALLDGLALFTNECYLSITKIRSTLPENEKPGVCQLFRCSIRRM